MYTTCRLNPEGYFEEMNKLNKSLGFKELSMGMSSDFTLAIKHLATYIRVDLVFLDKDFK